MRKHPPGDTKSPKLRNVRATIPLVNRLTAVPSPNACARNRRGKISEVRIQQMGPNPRENDATKAYADTIVRAGAELEPPPPDEGNEFSWRRRMKPRASPRRESVMPRRGWRGGREVGTVGLHYWGGVACL